MPAGVGLAQAAVPPLLELLPLLLLELPLPPDELDEPDEFPVLEELDEPQAASSRHKHPATPARKIVAFTLNLLSTKMPLLAVVIFMP